MMMKLAPRMRRDEVKSITYGVVLLKGGEALELLCNCSPKQAPTNSQEPKDMQLTYD